MKKEIKMLTKDNVSDVYEIEKSAFKNPWSYEMIKEEEENPLANYFILYVFGIPVAYGGVLKIVDEGHITNIAVKKEYQHKGYGNEILKILLSFMESEKLSFLTLEVAEDNIRAINLYEKFGFVKEGMRKNYYENNKTALIYSLRRK